ncbi:MAG: hypothetical protein AAF530_12915 [Pseudomonadota bacterium]
MSINRRSQRRGIRRLLPVLAIFIFFVGIYLFFLGPREHSGTVVAVQDGQTIEVATQDGNEVIRLAGLVAPLEAEAQSQQAHDYLQNLALNQEVTCRLEGDVTAEASLAICIVNGGDLGEALVLAGLARDCPAQSGGRYQAAEKQSRSQGSELHLTFALPRHCEIKDEPRDK